MHFFCWGLALLFLGCAGTIPEPGPQHVQWAQGHGLSVGLAELQEGRKALVQKCDGCHALPRMRRYQAVDWPAVMDSMKIAAELNSKEDFLIRSYLTTASGFLHDSLNAEKALKSKKR